jgi:hypothetical protein
MLSVLSLPKWARKIIEQQKYEKERLQRSLDASQRKVVSQSEEIQYLLDIVRNLRPDLISRWNMGVPLATLLEESKGPPLATLIAREKGN